MDKQKVVYWEKQESDLLCGLHSLNSLLQGPIFNEFDLAQIGQTLDQQETQLLQGQKNNTNVNLSGNFSFQVLIQALKQIGNFHIQSITSSEFKSNFNENLSHWFTIRNLHGYWINLNSTCKKYPQIISDFYLAAFIDSILSNGYLIFAINGDFQYYDQSIFELQNFQKFIPMEEILAQYEEDKKNPKFKLNSGGTDEDILEKILEQSKKEYEQKNQSQQQQNEQKDEKPKFEGQGIKIEEKNLNLKSDDVDLEQVMILSLQENFPEQKNEEQTEDDIMIKFRLPDGKQVKRFFSKKTQMQTIYDFVISQLQVNRAIVLKIPFDDKNLESIHLTLEDIEIETGTNINVFFKQF